MHPTITHKVYAISPISIFSHIFLFSMILKAPYTNPKPIGAKLMSLIHIMLILLFNFVFYYTLYYSRF